EADRGGQVAGELLGGRAAAAGVVERQLPDHSARDAPGIEAPVLVEAPILDRDDGLRDVLGHRMDGDRGAALESELAHLTSVCGEELARLLVLEGLDLGDEIGRASCRERVESSVGAGS